MDVRMRVNTACWLSMVFLEAPGLSRTPNPAAPRLMQEQNHQSALQSRAASWLPKRMCYGARPCTLPQAGASVSFRLSQWGSGSLVHCIWRYFLSLPYSYNSGSPQEVIPLASFLKPFSRDSVCHMPGVGSPASRANLMLDPTGISSVSYAGDNSHSNHPHITLGHHFRTPQQHLTSSEPGQDFGEMN